MAIQGVDTHALTAAFLIAGLLVNCGLILSMLRVIYLCLVRGPKMPVSADTAPRPSDVEPPQAQALLREGFAWYASFGWKARTLIVIASVLTNGRFALNRAAFCLSLVAGFYRSVQFSPDGGVWTNGASWAKAAEVELHNTFSGALFSRALAAEFVGRMSQADTSRLFKSYFALTLKNPIRDHQ